MNRSGLLPRILLGVTLLLAIVLLVTRCERYSYIQHDAPPAKVLSNPFYAAGILLEQRGRPARTLHGNPALFPLPATDTLLILDKERSGLNDLRARQLRQWVANGGTLLVASGPPPEAQRHTDTPGQSEHTDPLLSPLGITAARSDVAVTGDGPTPFADQLPGMEGLFHRFCLYAGEEISSDCERAMCGRQRTLYDTPFYSRNAVQDDPDRLHRIAFDARITLRYDDALLADMAEPVLSRLAGNAAGTQLIELEYGAGRIIVVTDLRPWHNTQLHYLDHAWMLDYLSTESRRVWFVQGLTMPPLHHWLWQKAAPLILALTLLLLLFLWRHLPRRGTLLDDAGPRPGDFLDHLLASGRLLWRTGNQTALMAGLRDEVRQRLRYHGDDAAEQYAAAARLSGLPVDRIANALAEQPGTDLHSPLDSDALQHDIQTLHILRRSL